MDHVVMVMTPGARCRYPGCDKEAVCLAVGRETSEGPGSPLAPYYHDHATQVAAEDQPEYVQHCPNCGCRFGVN